MRATLKDHVVANSDDVTGHDGYCYFRREDVRMAWLEARGG